MARVADIAASLDVLAPRRLAEDWDNVGLLVGDPDGDVTTILCTLDLDAAQLDEAARLNAELVVAFHPVIFKPLARLTAGDARSGVVHRAAREGRSVVVTHTALDRARRGTSDYLAEALGLSVSGVLRPAPAGCLKLIVFVPPGDADTVAAAMAAAGAGRIGDYAECSFRSSGEGRFRGLAGAQPAVGAAGRLEAVSEVRLEMLVPEALAARVVAAMIAAHPYEEVAYDLVKLVGGEAGTGFGRLAELPEPLALAEFAELVRQRTGAETVRVAGESRRLVQRVALMGGSGAAFVEDAARAGAQVLVTGDLKHHDGLLARRLGLALVDPGHAATELPAVSATAEWLRERWPELVVRVSEVGAEPFAAA